VKNHHQQDPLHGVLASVCSDAVGGALLSDLWMWRERIGAEEPHSARIRALLCFGPDLAWFCGLNVHLGLQCLSCTPEGHCEFYLKGTLVICCVLHVSSELGTEEGPGLSSAACEMNLSHGFS